MIIEDEEVTAWTPYRDAVRWRRRFWASVALNVVLAIALLYFTRS